jgi:Holliday junction resolvase RusA-like endonuclease
VIELQVTVLGEPVGQGAMSGGGMRQGKHGGMYHQPQYASNRKKLDPWRKAIVAATKQRMHQFGLAAPLADPLALSAVFSMTRGVTVTREEPTVPPDLDHLARAVGDSLVMAGAIRDDALLVEMRLRKQYEAPGLPPGVRFTLEKVPSAQQEIAA